MICAPFPATEVPELPYLLIATTLAEILDPQLRLNGELIKVET
jgi:hypothetical protein